MKLEDYHDYKKTNIKASKSQLKEYIKIYINIIEKTKNENGFELIDIKRNIKETYLNEIYFTLIDESDKFVKFTLTESSKEYIIPIFTDVREYDNGCAKISKLFLDKLKMKVITPEDISKIRDNDKYFKGFVINPHSQNFNMNQNADF